MAARLSEWPWAHLTLPDTLPDISSPRYQAHSLEMQVAATHCKLVKGTMYAVRSFLSTNTFWNDSQTISMLLETDISRYRLRPSLEIASTCGSGCERA